MEKPLTEPGRHTHAGRVHYQIFEIVLAYKSLLPVLFACLATTATAQISFEPVLESALRQLYASVDRTACGPARICNGEPARPPSVCIFADAANNSAGCGDRAAVVKTWALETFGNESRGAEVAELREVVALTNGSGVVLCSGTAVGPNHVLTAKHCVDKFGDDISHVFFGSKTRFKDGRLDHDGWHFEVTAKGDLCAGDQCESTISGEVLDLAQVRFAPPRPIDPSFFWAPDWSMPRIAQSRDRGRQLLPFNGRNAWFIAGFGATEDHRTPFEKRFANMNVPADLCDGSVDGCLPGEEFAVISDDDTRVDTCSGDSGGPIFDENGHLVGVTSRQIDPSPDAP